LGGGEPGLDVRNLTRLEIINCDNVDDQVGSLLVQHALGLRYFKMEGLSKWKSLQYINGESLHFDHLNSLVITNCSNLYVVNMVVPSLHHFKAQHCSQLKTISLASAKLHSLYLSHLPLLNDDSVITLMKVLAFPVSQFNIDLPIFHQLPKDDAKALKAIIERDSSAQFSFDTTLRLFHVVLSHAPSVLSLLTTLKFTNLTIGSEFLNHLSSLSSLTTLHLQNINSRDTIYDSLTFLHLISFVITNCSHLQALNMVVPSLHHFKAQYCSQLKSISLAYAQLHSLYLSHLPLLDDHSIITLIQSISVTSFDTIFIKTQEDTENIKALLERTSSSVHLTSWLASKFFFFILSHKFSDMNFITSLDLSYNKIGAEGAKNLSSLSSLTTLDLSVNNIADEGAKSLTTLTSLTELYIDSNNISSSVYNTIMNDIGSRPRKPRIEKGNGMKNEGRKEKMVNAFECGWEIMKKEEKEEKEKERERNKEKQKTRERARQKEKSEKVKRTGLGIDGGGIRGVIPALMLERVEEVCKPRRIHELFEMIGGTSIGGIIGLCCSASIDEKHPIIDTHSIVNIFHQDGEKIFAKEKGVKQMWSKMKQLWSIQYVTHFENKNTGANDFSDIQQNHWKNG
jgi:hypothetical protein